MEESNKENQIKRNPTSKNLRQVNTIIYKIKQEKYEIKVCHHLNSWDIPNRYYNAHMDPVKAFLLNNTIKNYINRVYWMNKRTLY